MIQKIIKVGNSYAVTIPRRFVDSLDIEDDARVHLALDDAQGKVILDFQKPYGDATEVVDPEVYKVAKKLLKQYLPAFKELAKK